MMLFLLSMYIPGGLFKPYIGFSPIRQRHTKQTIMYIKAEKPIRIKQNKSLSKTVIHIASMYCFLKNPIFKNSIHITH